MGSCLLAQANMDMAVIMIFEVILSLIFLEKKKITIMDPVDILLLLEKAACQKCNPLHFITE